MAKIEKVRPIMKEPIALISTIRIKDLAWWRFIKESHLFDCPGRTEEPESDFPPTEEYEAVFCRSPGVGISVLKLNLVFRLPRSRTPVSNSLCLVYLFCSPYTEFNNNNCFLHNIKHNYIITNHHILSHNTRYFTCLIVKLINLSFYQQYQHKALSTRPRMPRAEGKAAAVARSERLHLLTPGSRPQRVLE